MIDVENLPGVPLFPCVEVLAGLIFLGSSLEVPSEEVDGFRLTVIDSGFLLVDADPGFLDRDPWTLAPNVASLSSGFLVSPDALSPSLVFETLEVVDEVTSPAGLGFEVPGVVPLTVVGFVSVGILPLSWVRCGILPEDSLLEGPF